MDDTQAMELLESFVRQGETIDPDNMSLLYGWIFSAAVAIQPYPTQHKEFCNNCRNSFAPPRERLSAGLATLRKAVHEARAGAHGQEKNVTADYWKLLNRTLNKGG